MYYCCYCSYWREIIHSVALISLPEAYGMIREWPSLEGHNPNSTIIIIIILVQPAQSGLVAWVAIVELCGTVVTTHFIRSNNDKLLRDSSALLVLLKVSKFEKQIFLFSFEPKNEQNYFLIYALVSKNGSNQKKWRLFIILIMGYLT